MAEVVVGAPIQERAMTDRELAPDERLHEIAAILAKGILRLGMRQSAPPEDPSTSPQQALDVAAEQRLHVSVG